MNNPILRSIEELRPGAQFVVDKGNTNEYKIVLDEQDRSKTAYCFSVPIYNNKSGKLLDMKFYKKDNGYYAEGSSAYINISDNIKFKNSEGDCSVNFSKEINIVRSDEYVLSGNSMTFYRTTNGLAIKVECDRSGCQFTVKTNKLLYGLRGNNKCFSLMVEEFRPFITVSCIGSVNRRGEIIAPALLKYEEEDNKRYNLSICPQSSQAYAVIFEINMYEPKLFQDTTVESNNPDMNNSFGGIAYIGQTDLYGEQWLYTRPAVSMISEITDKKINKVILHMRQFNNAGIPLSGFRVESRFCSFGSTWNNRMNDNGIYTESFGENSVRKLNITDLLVHPSTGCLIQTDGLIIKPTTASNGFAAISTGDSYYVPQILEINYK